MYRKKGGERFYGIETGSYTVLKLGYGIEGVAVFTLIAYFSYNSMMLYNINRALGNRIDVFFRRLKEGLACPLIILIFCLVYLQLCHLGYILLCISEVAPGLA